MTGYVREVPARRSGRIAGHIGGAFLALVRSEHRRSGIINFRTGEGPPGHHESSRSQVQESLVPHYRCYHMYTDKSIIGVELFERPNDSDACIRATEIAVAKDWLGHELWEFGRKVDCSKFNL